MPTKRDLALAAVLLLLGVALCVVFAWACLSTAFAPPPPRIHPPFWLAVTSFVALAMGCGFLEAFVKITLALFTKKRFDTLVSRKLWYAILVGFVALLVFGGVSAVKAGDVIGVSLAVAMLGALAFAVTRVRSALHTSSLANVASTLGIDPEPHRPLPPIPAWFQRAPAVGGYSPNRIDLSTRVFHVLSSLGLLAYGAFGLWIDDLYVPGKRGKGIHFHGIAAVTMFFAMLSACVVLCSVVVDHYDRRDNESAYRRVATYGEFVGWSLMFAAVLLELP
jgi:MFS family permease